MNAGPVIAIAVVVLTLLAIACTASTKAPPSTAPGSRTVEYTTLDDGMIVLALDYLNDADMTHLGEQLKHGARKDSQAHISVYTDASAAAMRPAAGAGLLSAQDGAFYDQHYVAQYTKNESSGLDQFRFFPGGLGSPEKVIDY